MNPITYPRKRKCCGGITLLELCFALAVAGVLAGLAIPSLRSARNAGAVHGAAFELVAGLQQARAGSIVEARPGVLCLSDAAGNCLRGGGPAGAWRAYLDNQGQETTLALRSLPAGILLHATRPKLTFWPHSLSASTTTLTICDARGSARPRAIVVSQTGRARLMNASKDRCRP
jgi:type IV fimbrial biogenesis protein FimT